MTIFSVITLALYLGTLVADKQDKQLRHILTGGGIIISLYLAQSLIVFSGTNLDSLSFWASTIQYSIYLVEIAGDWVIPPITILVFINLSFFWAVGKIEALVVDGSVKECATQALNKEYQEEIARLQESHKDKVNKLNLQYEKDMTSALYASKGAQTSHKVKIDRLKQKYESQVHNIRLEEKNRRNTLEQQIIFLKRQSNNPFDAKTLRDITILCHPDKHGGSQKAVQVTQLLNSLRSK